MIACTKCKKLRPLNSFNFKNERLSLRHKQCKYCTRKALRAHYRENREYYLRKTLKRNKGIRIEVNEFVRNYLNEHPCVDCRESDATVLEFDHRGDVLKIKAVSTLIGVRSSIEKVKAEIDKCDVRCANCHRRKTAKDFGWQKSIIAPVS